MNPNKPRVGQNIYVPDTYDFGSRNDFRGGLATIAKVYSKKNNGMKSLFVEVEEHPSFEYAYDDLIRNGKQESLTRRYGRFRARSLLTRYEREKTL